MKNRQNIIIAILAILVVYIVFGLFSSTSTPKDENDQSHSPQPKTETEIIASLTQEFMEEAYINGNFKKVTNKYIPPEGFETLLSNEPMSLENYIEWFVRSVDLLSYGQVTSVKVVDVEKTEDRPENPELLESELFQVTFHFIKSNGLPVYFGPCCGDDSPPNPNMYIRVIKTGNQYKIYQDLPYRP